MPLSFGPSALVNNLLLLGLSQLPKCKLVRGYTAWKSERLTERIIFSVPKLFGNYCIGNFTTWAVVDHIPFNESSFSTPYGLLLKWLPSSLPQAITYASCENVRSHNDTKVLKQFQCELNVFRNFQKADYW